MTSRADQNGISTFTISQSTRSTTDNNDSSFSFGSRLPTFVQSWVFFDALSPLPAMGLWHRRRIVVDAITQLTLILLLTAAITISWVAMEGSKSLFYALLAMLLVHLVSFLGLCKVQKFYHVSHCLILVTLQAMAAGLVWKLGGLLGASIAADLSISCILLELLCHERPTFALGWLLVFTAEVGCVGAYEISGNGFSPSSLSHTTHVSMILVVIYLSMLGLVAMFAAYQKLLDHEFRARAISEKNESASAESVRLFLANISHEIRTPLNGILGMTELLLDTCLPFQRDRLECIQASGNVLLHLVSDVLDMSKLEAGKIQLENLPFDLRHCIEHCCMLMASKVMSKGVDLIINIPRNLCVSVLGDSVRIQQVLNNLIGNASKFTESGSITVSIAGPTSFDDSADGGSVSDAEIAHASSAMQTPQQHDYTISVADTGLGISDEQMARLFDPFAQAQADTSRRFGGTGLGLYISRRLVELWNGTISGTSAGIGLGTTFSFTVPLQFNRVTTPTTEIGEGTVMIVDENEASADALIEYVSTTARISRWYKVMPASFDDFLDFDVVLISIPASRIVSAESLCVGKFVLSAEWLLEISSKGSTKIYLLTPPNLTPLAQCTLKANCLEKPLRLSRLQKALQRNSFSDCGGRTPTTTTNICTTSSAMVRQLLFPTGLTDTTINDITDTSSSFGITPSVVLDILTAPSASDEASRITGSSSGGTNQVGPTLSSLIGSTYGPRVLIADDNAISCQVLEGMLRKFGFEIDVAHDGTQALAMATARSDYGIVFLDLYMPGLDGELVASAIRQIPAYCQTPIIFVSGASLNPQEEENIKKLDPTFYLFKPVRMNLLSEAVAWARQIILRPTPTLSNIDNSTSHSKAPPPGGLAPLSVYNRPPLATMACHNGSFGSTPSSRAETPRAARFWRGLIARSRIGSLPTNHLAMHSPISDTDGRHSPFFNLRHSSLFVSTLSTDQELLPVGSTATPSSQV